jgi:hypothetical protein
MFLSFFAGVGLSAPFLPFRSAPSRYAARTPPIPRGECSHEAQASIGSGGTTTQAQIGAMNTLLGCINAEA